jgi:hypothetical protein
MCILKERARNLTLLQPHFRRERRRRPTAWPVGTVVCLILLALLTVVQVAHIHTSDSDADHCPLCVVMHTAAPVAVAAAAIVLVQVGTSAPLVQARAIVRHWDPKLFTRPPPFGC